MNLEVCWANLLARRYFVRGFAYLVGSISLRYQQGLAIEEFE